MLSSGPSVSWVEQRYTFWLMTGSPGGKTPGLTIAELKESGARVQEDILRLRDEGDGLGRDRRPSLPA
jgi:hypothetical protein